MRVGVHCPVRALYVCPDAGMGMLSGSEDAPETPRHALVSGSVAAGCASGNSSTGRIVARDAVAPSTSQETAKQVSETGPAWEGACARRGEGGGGRSGHVRGGVDGRRRDGWAETRAGEDGGRAAGEEATRGGRRREGARTVHVAKVRASIANAVEVQTRRAGARARARDPRGAPRATPSPSWTDARRRAPRRPAEATPGRPRPRRDEMRSDGYGVGGARRAMRWLARVRLVRLEARRPSGRGALCSHPRGGVVDLHARGSKHRDDARRSNKQIDELRTRRNLQ